MQNNKLCAIIIVLVVIAGNLFIFPVVSSVTSSIILRSSGQITIPNVTAESGSARDIQAAVDWVAGHGGIGNVTIPEGIFNFVEVGEPWMTVNVPAGVNIFGATTQRDVNNQAVEWKTILVMPWEVPGDWNSMPTWFKLGDGSQDPNKPTRFSDIKLVGYRSIDSSSITVNHGIEIYGIINFRIDHCMFEHVTGSGVNLPAWYQQNMKCSGVIDHCKFVNYHGFDDLANMTNGNIGYGVEIQRSYVSTPQGDPMPFEPTMDILGQYNDHTVFIEDCYFSKWRHCVASGHGAHYVFRYNVIDQDFGHFSLDAHGLRDPQTGRAGTRAVEIYENRFQNIISPDEHGGTSARGVMQNGGGCGVFFNNEIDSSYWAIALYAEDYVVSDTWHLKDFYMWGNKGTLTPTITYTMGLIDSSRNVVEAWSRPAYDPTDPRYPNVDPSWSIAGYTPYTYPHPLTMG